MHGNMSGAIKMKTKLLDIATAVAIGLMLAYFLVQGV
jgi:low affinity Fe/Cu permease